MRRTTERMVTLVAVVVGLMVALAAPTAAVKYQISGVAFYDPGSVCEPLAGYTQVPPIVMTGDLNGCWYTKIVSSKDNGLPSGVYQERGDEIFLGTLKGGHPGTFRTTYKFSSNWDPELTGGSEVHGRCQHPIVADSGTGAFAGVTGRVDFKDDVATGCLMYRGHLTMP